MEKKKGEKMFFFIIYGKYHFTNYLNFYLKSQTTQNPVYDKGSHTVSSKVKGKYKDFLIKEC